MHNYDTEVASTGFVNIRTSRDDVWVQLREYLYNNLYYNSVVHKPNQRAIKLLEALFNYYLEHPDHIGNQSQARIETDGLHRAICDYLSGMTDRYVALEHKRLDL